MKDANRPLAQTFIGALRLSLEAEDCTCTPEQHERCLANIIGCCTPEGRMLPMVMQNLPLLDKLLMRMYDAILFADNSFGYGVANYFQIKIDQFAEMYERQLAREIFLKDMMR